jgi:predicted HTH domain antitoxin
VKKLYQQRTSIDEGNASIAAKHGPHPVPPQTTPSSTAHPTSTPIPHKTKAQPALVIIEEEDEEGSKCDDETFSKQEEELIDLYASCVSAVSLDMAVEAAAAQLNEAARQQELEKRRKIVKANTTGPQRSRDCHC